MRRTERARLFGATGYIALGILPENNGERRPEEFAIFALIGIVGLEFNVIIWFVRVENHSHYMTGKSISAGIILSWNFGARKFVLFR